MGSVCGREWEQEHGALTREELARDAERVAARSDARSDVVPGDETGRLTTPAPFVAADRSDRGMWAEAPRTPGARHRADRTGGHPRPGQPIADRRRAPPAARGCEIAALTSALAHRAGALLAKVANEDVADASLVAVALDRKADNRDG